MPLPPALAAKLAQRGLIQQKHRSITGNAPLVATSTFPPGYVEEIIAENYDDDTETLVPAATKISKFLRLGHPGCPNKYNLYHTCTQLCVTRWGRGRANPESRYNKSRLRMLKKYPLPTGWQEVYDPGCGRYYYWNLDTDGVCWICPSHPKAVVTRPAGELRAQMLETGNAPGGALPVVSPQKYGGKESDRRRNREDQRNSRKKQGKVDDLDPMDPAAYSDIPRGDWNAGLEKPGLDGKTGADTTASGPLFQSRPYPNPGAILRANAAAGGEQKGRKNKSK